ncbi:hypothetical protein DU505_08595 [Billgrantia montanilacus]|uniref:Uncharacterized protein n=1 Tax=Billgrantia montanilacus TaxID=2282305 RepID=A0A368TXZ9_9GAMM|nr:hypothetical protein DU505_08595 [Halomonas montanilacus]
MYGLQAQALGEQIDWNAGLGRPMSRCAGDESRDGGRRRFVRDRQGILELDVLLIDTQGSLGQYELAMTVPAKWPFFMPRFSSDRGGSALKHHYHVVPGITGLGIRGLGMGQREPTQQQRK